MHTTLYYEMKKESSGMQTTHTNTMYKHIGLLQSVSYVMYIFYFGIKSTAEAALAAHIGGTH
jgi:hypothetical protein